MGHPAHFHLFKNLIHSLPEKDVLVVISNKDILKNLLDENKIKYHLLAEYGNKQSSFSKLLKLVRTTWNLLRITIKYKPDILIGCLSQIAWVGSLTRKKTLFFAEDDFAYTSIQCRITYPFVTNVLTAEEVNVGPFAKKQIKYPSYHKLAYLHPEVFQKVSSNLKKYNISTPFFIVRMVNLSAHHDSNIEGITDVMLDEIIQKLSISGRVILSSEKRMNSSFDKHLLPIDLSDMHQLMSQANGIISDSQSMTVEACMLGIPNIRINSFKGKISVLNNLETNYNLTKSVTSSEFKIQDLDYILNADMSEFEKNREQLVKDKIYPTPFYLKQINNL
jgi:predicted glycosyltransferase